MSVLGELYTKIDTQFCATIPDSFVFYRKTGDGGVCPFIAYITRFYPPICFSGKVTLLVMSAMGVRILIPHI